MCVVTRSPCGNPAASHSLLRFRQAGRRDVAHRDIAGFRHQLTDQLAAHAAAAAGDYRGPPSEFSHMYLPSFPGPSRGRTYLPVGSLTADKCDRDMPHRRIGLGAVPMALTGFDVDDIADIDLALFALCRHHPRA